MQPSRRLRIYASFALLLPLVAPRTFAKDLTITSAPPGASVEIDGVVVCKTPCNLKYPGGYFHKSKTIFGSTLGHAMRARIYKDGFTLQDISLTKGPFEWISLTGRKHGEYWLFKADHIEVTLEPAREAFTGTVSVRNARADAVLLRPESAVEESTLENVVEAATPAVVRLVGENGWGSGFFITATGVIATNAHVAREEASPQVECRGRGTLLGHVIYVDPKLDLALVKVDGSDFPHLTLASLAGVQTGETVIAIGNPGHGVRDTVTRGIVSGIGKDPGHNAGQWIQTDAAINPGNSGGPLLDLRGEVIGLNTEIALGPSAGGDNIPLQGIAFALSADDLIQVLHRFYPDSGSSQATAGAAALPLGQQQHAATERTAEISPARTTGTVAIASNPEGAEIYLDGKFVGQTPANLQLPSGVHHVEVRFSEQNKWERDLEVLAGSDLTLNASAENSP